MLLAQGRFWRAALSRSTGAVTLELRRAGLPDDLAELRELKIDVPLEKWNLVVKNLYSDRKLVGGLLLDFARHKERVSAAVASDRLLAELRRVVLEATVSCIEDGALSLVAPTSDPS